MTIKILLLFLAFLGVTFSQEVVMRGFSFEKRPSPPLLTSDTIFAGSSDKGTVWLTTTRIAPRKTILFLQTSSKISKLAELAYAASDLVVGGDVAAIGTINEKDSFDKVWWVDLNTGKTEIVVGYNLPITAIFQPPGLPSPITAPATVQYWTFLGPDGYTRMTIETGSRARYAGIFQYLGGARYKQVRVTTTGFPSIWSGNSIWSARGKLYYRETDGGLFSNTDRLVEYDLAGGADRRIFDASRPIFGEAIASSINGWYAVPDEDRTQFIVSYQTTPWKQLEWYDNPKNRVALVPVQGEIRQIYSTDQAVGEFGRPWDANVGAVGKTFVVLSHRQQGPTHVPVGVGNYFGAQYYVSAPPSFLSVFDGQSVRSLLRVGDILAGKKIAKLGSVAAHGCQADILAFGEDGSPEVWRLRMPCILNAPTIANTDDTLTLTGQNFTVGNPAAVDVLVNGIPVHPISVANDRATLSLPASATGTATLAIRLTHPSGTVTSNTVTIKVTGPPPPPLPVFTAQGVVNGATFLPGISPGALVSIFGANLATKEAKAESLPLPTTLGGVQVTFDGHPAPLWYVSPNQLNLQVPLELGAPADIRVQVSRDGVKSAVVMVRLDQISPGVFRCDGIGIVTHADYRLITPDNPLRSGEPGILWTTGLGPTNPPATTGKPSPPLAAIINSIYLTIAGQEAEVLFAGLSPGLVGVYQVNFRLPSMVGGNGHPKLLDGTLAVGNSRADRFQIAIQ